MQEQILAKLAEVADMLACATCSGQLLDGQVAEEVNGTLSTLQQQVEYYVD